MRIFHVTLVATAALGATLPFACAVDVPEVEPAPPDASAGMSGGGVGGAGGGAGTGGAGESGIGGGGMGGGLPPYGFRRRLTVQARSAVSARYSVSVAVNHAAMVSDGQAKSDGEDLRIFRQNGSAWTELDRVLGFDAQWNTSGTTIWFATEAPIQDASSDDAYFIYYGDPAATSAPADPNAVFAFFEDFDNGGFAGWVQLPATYYVDDTTRAHSGTHAVHAGALNGITSWLLATDVRETDVAMDVYWWMGTSAETDCAQAVRATGAPFYSIETNLEGTQGWNFSKTEAGAGTRLVSDDTQPIHPSATWSRMTLMVVGQRAKLLRDGAQLLPRTGWSDLATTITDGSVAIRCYAVPAEGVWLDDIRVRKLVEQEPTVSLGTEEVGPFGTGP